jgi:hypothetical protein
VPYASAVVPGQANAESVILHADHINMVKYSSKEDSNYITISQHLQIMTTDATKAVHTRWEARERSNKSRRKIVPVYGLFGLLTK